MKPFLAFLCSASALPELLIRRRLWPTPRAANAVDWNNGKGWYHNYKDETAEAFAADSGYFSKLTCFVIMVQSAIILMGIIY